MESKSIFVFESHYYENVHSRTRNYVNTNVQLVLSAHPSGNTYCADSKRSFQKLVLIFKVFRRRLMKLDGNDHNSAVSIPIFHFFGHHERKIKIKEVNTDKGG